MLYPFQNQILQILHDRHFFNQGPNHVICVAPTGSGKSRIFEEFFFNYKIKMVLVSPLVALSRQIANGFVQRHVKVAQGADCFRNLESAEIVILSPEQLEQSVFWDRLKKFNPDLLVVDECHCVLDWGEGFRPSFLKILDLLKELPSLSQSLWLTATLPKKTEKQIIEKAFKSKPLDQWIKIGRFEFPKDLFVRFTPVPWYRRIEMLLDRVGFWLGEPGIIFCATRESARRIYRILLKVFGEKVSVELYHAGLSSEERVILEKKVKDQKISILVATTAFGMGMDFHQFSWVLLFQAPLSVLALAQMLGRVGRAGKRGFAEVLWDPDDFRLLDWATVEKPKVKEDFKETLNLLTYPRCREQGVALALGEKENQDVCRRCDFCLSSSSIIPRILI